MDIDEMPGDLRRVLEALSDGVVVVDQGGTILFANPRAEKLTGYTAPELAGQRIELLVPEASRSSHERLRLGYLAGGAPPRPMGRPLSIQLRRRDGSPLPVDIALSPVETSAGRVVIAAIRSLGEVYGDGARQDLQWLERELLEGALQVLFGVSLSLQTTASLTDDGKLRERLELAVGQIEGVNRDLRNYLLGLRRGILADTPEAERG